MSDPNDPIQIFTIGVPGPSGLPMQFQGAPVLIPANSPVQLSVLQAAMIDVRAGNVTVIFPPLVDASTSVVMVKDLYSASGTFLITLQGPGGGVGVENPNARGTFVTSSTWPHMQVPPAGTGTLWYAAMASINAWVIIVG